MKLLTLNTHSLIESDYLRKLKAFVNFVVRQMPNIIFLQEIMQPANSKVSTANHTVVGNIPLKEGNHALNIVKLLKECGIEYKLVWLGIKKSYDQFDEGIATLTLSPYDDTDEICLSPFDDYANWKTRKALGIRQNGIWYYNVHMGWWSDKESPFQYELISLLNGAKDKDSAYFAGDFNTLSTEKGYELILEAGLYDTYSLAKEKDEGITAVTGIDGWHHVEGNRKIRIDYIFSNRSVDVQSSYTVFNGKVEPAVSDHFGILLII